MNGAGQLSTAIMLEVRENGVRCGVGAGSGFLSKLCADGGTACRHTPRTGQPSKSCSAASSRASFTRSIRTQPDAPDLAIAHSSFEFASRKASGGRAQVEPNCHTSPVGNAETHTLWLGQSRLPGAVAPVARTWLTKARIANLRNMTRPPHPSTGARTSSHRPSVSRVPATQTHDQPCMRVAWLPASTGDGSSARGATAP